jgi:hypothetical protein
MNYQPKLKNFINTFNFPKAKFSRLPEGFPYCNLERLTDSEKLVYGGIVIAWYNTREGQSYLLRKFAKPAGTALVLFIGLASLINLILAQPEGLTGTVSAATQAADEVIQSTMSAILRR